MSNTFCSESISPVGAEVGSTRRTPNLDATEGPRSSIESDLRRALAAGELSLQYQPIIDAKTRSPAAVEALLRWNSAERGLVPADHFVPLAEDLGISGTFTLWVLDRAARELGPLMARHPELKLSINLPADEVSLERVRVLLRCLADCGTFGPERLQVEITERTLLADSPAVREALEALAQAGVSLAIDDFGTGYSSLSYLDRYPITCLKIDKSFVSRLTTSPRSRKLTEAIVLMAGALGVPAVAEGVEDVEQLAFLVAKGCRYIQGYLFAKPLAIAPLEAFFASFRFPEALLEAALWPQNPGMPRLLADNQEQALRLFVEHVPAAVAMFDPDMRYLAASARWIHDNKLGGQDLVGRSHYEIVPATTSRWRGIYARCLAGAVERNDEDSYVDADGKTQWLRWEIHPFTNGIGDVAGIIVFCELITERKEAERRQRASEQLLANFLETAYDWLWETDAEHRFFLRDHIGATPDAQAEIDAKWQAGSAGWGRDSDLGCRRWEMPGVEPGQDDVWDAHRADLAARRPFRNLVFARQTATGERVWREVSGQPVFGDNGEFQGYRGTARDVTPRVEAVQRQRESEQRLSDYLATASDWIWESDTEHRFLSVIGVHDMPQWPGDGDVGRRRWELVGIEPGQDALWEAHRADLEARRPFRNLLFARWTAAGELTWREVSGRPVFDEKGTFRGYRGTARDVTARIAAENAVRTQTAQLELASEMADLGHWEIDLIAQRSTWSPAVVRITGRDPASFAGEFDRRYEVFHPDDREAVREEARAAAAARRPYEVTGRIVRPDGTIRQVHLKARPELGAAGQLLGYFGILQDITGPNEAAAEPPRIGPEDRLRGKR